MTTARHGRVMAFAATMGDLLLGAVCLGCGEPWWGVCPGCRDGLAARDCRPTRPDPCPPQFPRTFTSSPYDDLASALIHAYKDDQALTLSRLLGLRLALAVDGLLAGAGIPPTTPVLLVPVPSSRAAVRERGLDASLTLARSAARRLRRRGRPVEAAHRLRQRHRLLDQAGLSAAERAANLSGGLVTTWAVAGERRPVVLVDDVVTTGASLTEAARALGEAGLEIAGAATVAAAVRRRSSHRGSAAERS